MAVVAHLLEHTSDVGDNLINNVAAMILGADTAVDTTLALVRARGVTVWNAVAANVNAQLPAGYFDTARVISTTFATAADYATFGGRYKQAEVVG